MMIQRLSTILLTLFIVVMSMGKVQAQNEGFQKAEKLYKAGDYYSAIAYYNDFLTGKASKITINGF